MSFFAAPPRIETEVFSRLPDRFRQPRRTAWGDANRAGRPVDDRLVGLAHAALREQALVGPARGRIGREQYQPGGAAIDAVDRHQVVQAQGALESHQQGVAGRGRAGERFFGSAGRRR